jgi:glycosyltransferase involved in cell wall biosynthesis
MPHLVYLTAGAAGMFCGSCMHDNALARAILADGQWDVTLVPTYTPIRTDEDDVSVDQVFFGGINVYLQQKLPWLRFVPSFLDRWLDHPALIRRLTAKASDTSPKLLGQLAVSMLKGREGNQRKEVFRLLRWLKNEAKPDAIVLTNVLIGGCVELLQRELGVPVFATLQGDDAFLDTLPEPYRRQATELAGQVARRCDGLLVHSDCYADYMADYLDVPRSKMHRVTLCIDAQPWEATPARETAPDRLVLGYLARLAPEKGVDRLIDAFIALKQQGGFEHLQLRVAGWLGDHRRAWFLSHWERLAAAGLASQAEFATDVDRAFKLRFLNEVDLLCVPTQHFEPKGLFALEAMAAGVPVVVPAQGIFPELIASTGGGALCRPSATSVDAAGSVAGAEAAASGSLAGGSGTREAGASLPTLTQVLATLLSDPQHLRALGTAGRAAVLAKHHARQMARETVALLNQAVSSRAGRDGASPRSQGEGER